jgi:hypothetical protein
MPIRKYTPGVAVTRRRTSSTTQSKGAVCSSRTAPKGSITRNMTGAPYDQEACLQIATAVVVVDGVTRPGPHTR